MPFMMGMGGTPAIAVADGAVFVVQGGTLYKFNAETLELLGKVTFEQPPVWGAPGGPDRQGGRRGGGAGGAAGGDAAGGVQPPQ